MKSLRQSPASIALALLSLVGSAANGLGFVACGLELTKMVRGLGFLAPLLLVGPLGIGLLAVGLLEAAAAVGLCSGALVLLCGRRAGIWVTMVACGPALLAGLLVVTRLVAAPLIFGKEMAGLATQPVGWAILVCSLVTAISTVALAFSPLSRQPWPVHAG
ncbi:hypothetical protein OK015_03380 [Mycobacterium sp. Aquia_216]|uniref:hypothetical protein n=1 Tax=Mycobacterium sp. Aquia_216 TaxID=2991729 RepID=UPI00227B4BFA|nr:hypothetical protein [Mycobacterium sp. Aquia_216]WAJ45576.1 hypothetical protein OK015_03380 [Mycobacterium sp. Aquia_216]